MEKKERDGKFVHEGRKLHVLIPLEGNNTAVEAMKTFKEALGSHFQRIGQQIQAYDYEYKGMRKADSFTLEKIKENGFYIIPIESNFQETIN